MPVNTDEASLASLLLTCCCVAWFLTEQYRSVAGGWRPLAYHTQYSSMLHRLSNMASEQLAISHILGVCGLCHLVCVSTPYDVGTMAKLLEDTVLGKHPF